MSKIDYPIDRVQVNARLSENGLTLAYEDHSNKYLTLYNKYNTEVNIDLIEDLEDALFGYQFVSVIETRYLLFRKL